MIQKDIEVKKTIENLQKQIKDLFEKVEEKDKENLDLKNQIQNLKLNNEKLNRHKILEENSLIKKYRILKFPMKCMGTKFRKKYGKN